MIRTFFYLALLAFLSMPAFAGDTFTNRALLQKVPTIARSPELAYAMFIDKDGVLTPGPEFKRLDAMEKAEAMSGSQPTPSAQVQSQQAMAQQMQQRYGSAEGQAELQHMSPAQLMALAQSMSANMPHEPTTVSPHDQALLSRIDVYAGTADMEKALNDIRTQRIKLMGKWNADVEHSQQAEQQEVSSLPAKCRSGGDIAVADPSKERSIRLRHANERVQIAQKYLGQFMSLEQKMRAAVGPLVDHSDDAVSAWTQLHSPSMKQRLSSQAHSQDSMALEDVRRVEGLVESASEKAAQAVADAKHYKTRYPGGTCGHG